MEMELKYCANPNCTNTFRVNKKNPQKCCSEYCHAVTGNLKRKIHTDMTRKLSKLAGQARKDYYFWSDGELGIA